MVGTWCVFADDYDDEDEGTKTIRITVSVILGVAFLASMVLILTGHPDEGMELWNSVVEEPKPEEAQPAVTIMKNPFIQHGTIGVNKNKIFLGAKFSF